MVWAATPVRAFASPNLSHVRPWAWSPDDAAMAMPLSQTFHQLRINQGLEVVGLVTTKRSSWPMRIG